MAEINLAEVLNNVVSQQASDLHLQVGRAPVIRVGGNLIQLIDYGVLNDEVMENIIYGILDDTQKQTLNQNRELDFSFEFGQVGRFRVNVFYERGHLSTSMRLITNDILSIDELGLPKVATEFANYPHGLVLVTGPTSSGKSSTLASIIDKINTEQSKRIITAEDPIEFVHKHKRSSIVQREVNYDTHSFANALKSSLRQDPDIILVGEMRDLETISAAITAAETGHLVFSTLHTNSAAQTISRIIDVFPPHQQSQVSTQLSTSLKAVCSQRLVPAIAGGLVVATEILINNPAASNIIRENKSHQLNSVIQSGGSLGMHTLESNLANYVKGGVITFEKACEFANNKDEIDHILRG